MVEPASFMDDRQHRILASLQEKRSELGNFYRTALMLLSGELSVPDARTRVAFIGHCMREIMNRVLGSLGRPTAPRFTPSSNDQMKALPELFARFPELDLDREDGLVPVPQEVAVAMGKLFKAAIQEKRRIRDDVASLITDDDNASHVAVSRWIESRNYFVKWAHLHDCDVAEGDLPSDGEIREHIGVFEELIDGVITAFFATRHSIDDILAEVNATKDGKDAYYLAPTPESVHEALLKIPTYQLRRVFFDGLENPLWVRPLLSAGAFTAPPEPEPTGDGYIRDTYWPELSYLTRIASRAPDDVVDVFLRLKQSNNAWVRRAVVEIGSQIPTESSVRLEPLLKEWAKTGFGWRTDPQSLALLAVNLLEGGQPQLGRWLANVLFKPEPGNESDYFQKPVFLLEEYWYEEELPRMVLALGENALKALVGWLNAYVQHSGHSSGGRDSSAMIRSSIDERDDYTSGPEDALIDSVRDLAFKEVRIEPDKTVKILLHSGVNLLRKIAMHVVEEVISQELDSGADVEVFLGPATQLLGDDESYDEYLRVEYAQLARAVARTDGPATSVVTPFLAKAFEADLAWMHERLPRPEGLSDRQWEESIQAKAQRYRRTWLSAIGREALPADLRVELAKLEDAYGVVSDPLAPMGRVTSWTGPNPHTGQDEMAAMAPAELVALLANWHDEGDGWGPDPTHEGQGRALSSLLTAHPLALKGVPRIGEQLRPTYLRAILQGWESATKADLELDWSQVSELVEYVFNQPLSSPFPVEGDSLDDDKDFGGAKSAAVGLLEQLLKKRGSVCVPDEYEEVFARLLIERSDDQEAWTEYDAYRQENSDQDPLNMSLNWRWPIRVRALIVAATRLKAPEWRDKALQAIKFESSRVDRNGAGKAALGEGFGRLLNAVPDWINAQLKELVGNREGISTEQQIVLTTALATHHYNRSMYDLLAPSMIAALDVGDSLAAGWKTTSDPLQEIGEWVIEALLFGHIGTADPAFKSFFSKTSPTVRGDAMRGIARNIHHSTKIDDAILDRFTSLWDDRISHVRRVPEDRRELEGIYWLAKNSLFSPEWWLPRLREVLEFESNIATERLTIGKELAQASTKDPSSALAVLKLLLSGRREDGLSAYDLIRHAVPEVIAHAMLSSNQELTVQAEAYMNELGSQGNLALENQVRAVLDREINRGVTDE